MRKQFIMLSVLGGFWVGHMSAPAFADDVYVDLSVLRELQNTTSAANISAPLFPEVKTSRTPAVETSFPTISSKPAARKKTIQPQKDKPRKRMVKEDKSDKIVIPEKVVPGSGLKVAVPTVELKTVSENMEKDAAAPVAEIKKEPLPELKIEAAPTPTPDLSSEAAQVTAQPLVSKAFEAAKEEAETENTVSTNNEKSIEDITPSTSESVVEVQKVDDSAAAKTPSEAASKEMVFIPQTNAPTPPTGQSVVKPEPAADTQPSAQGNIQENNRPQLLVPAPSASTKAGANEIEFASGSEELSAQNQQKLDAIIAGFENPSENMIAINAYNYDDGNDVFSKKRLSLRRIVAIRSYLLNKGYKNFMPKVINITEDNGKSALVELEEIK